MKFPFKNSFLSWMLKKRMHQIDLFLKYPIAVQKEVLSVLLETTKDTAFAEDHDFASINSSYWLSSLISIMFFRHSAHYDIRY